MECEMVSDEYGEWVRHEDADKAIGQAYTDGENSGHADYIGELLEIEDREWDPVVTRQYIEAQAARIAKLEGLLEEWLEDEQLADRMNSNLHDRTEKALSK